ncbi:glycosyltransferase family 2 protein [Pedobacter metabolipauper]|uniref:Glycosyltransferase involved in cell wall biosynthesis n=1 Tax=Pedobacter metabolipauper TaxID=425513 RepID=A0A4R6SZ24_9SPHI|nr:glycosyltransferase family 2 protein [Pedobacter metabolipauper]TDQ09944.1 glycosyltransferase involved in cell wall biosynthesis [Pedobacter metabolipauper]
MPVKLTIGLPFYNNEKTLKKAIHSILLQTYDLWELILIDDGSTDHSLSIAKSIAEHDSRITLISDGKNRGLVNRLNQIIDLARGEYIARMDSDDIMMPDRLEKQMLLLTSDPEIDVTDSCIYIIDDEDNPYGKRCKKLNGSSSKKTALKGSILYHPTVIAKASWYKNNKYAEGFLRSEDYELWCRAFQHTKFIRIDEPLLLYREGMIDIGNYNQSMRSARKILKAYGPGTISTFEMAVEISKTYFKYAAYNFMGMFGKQNLLSATRNSSITEDQKRMIRAVIHRITDFKQITS